MAQANSQEAAYQLLSPDTLIAPATVAQNMASGGRRKFCIALVGDSHWVSAGEQSRR